MLREDKKLESELLFMGSGYEFAKLLFGEK
jgi:hypothetical protein